ncbi:non-ribosomal peptide synthetase [Streptomyces sp. NBC_00859]|uniref:non-ribosomal peptide synthetase n=1 Tax=Streptomyces sp. NBC_00859 TaxID=2903682 RepID=UPI00386FB6E8|nr:non-ribosomal peptide synthetase [Streptomyces sp. NBC_00859]
MTTLAGLFAAQAERTPHATAVIADRVTLDYAALARRVQEVADALRRDGIGPGSVVAVRMDRSPDLVVALLGVESAGAAYLPLDADTPQRRTELILDEAAPDRVLTALPVPPASADTGEGPVRRARAEDPAYVIYTSGSTGRPKGVVVRQEAIVSHLRWMQRAVPLNADDRVLVKTPVGFDVSTYEYFWPLICGAALVVAPPGLEREPHGLAALIARRGVTTVQFVPSMLRLFLDAQVTDRCRSLRRIVCIGEALPVSLRDRCLRLLDAELHNLYGPTEVTVAATAWHCRPGADPDSVPIGRPVSDTGAHVLDERLDPLPPGVTGELYLSGVQLAEGYLARPGLTAERFVASPLGPPGSRLYRTGDLARRRNDGVLEFIGRADGQVKFRGRRIELGEIETVLSAHPAVAQAAVVCAGPPDGDRWLACFVVPAPGRPAPDGQALGEHLRGSLPETMVPTAWAVLDRVPLTGNGKLDRAALPEPPRPGPAPRPGSPAPAARPADGAPEAWLCAATEEVLGLTAGDAAPGHSFIGLGGDSMAAMRLVNRAVARGIGITVADVVGAASLAELASAAAPGTTPGPDTEPELLPDLDPREYESLAAQLSRG